MSGLLCVQVACRTSLSVAPGSYTVSGLSTLTNALFAGGGVQKIGSLRRVELKREGETVREMDLYDLLLLYRRAF